MITTINEFRKFNENSDNNNILTFDQLEIGKTYSVRIFGDNGLSDSFIENEILLDKDKDSLLLINADYFKNELDSNKKSNPMKLTLDYMKNTGIDDNLLDENVYVYDLIDDKIETVLGFEVQFLKEL